MARKKNTTEEYIFFGFNQKIPDETGFIEIYHDKSGPLSIYGITSDRDSAARFELSPDKVKTATDFLNSETELAGWTFHAVHIAKKEVAK